VEGDGLRIGEAGLALPSRQVALLRGARGAVLLGVRPSAVAIRPAGTPGGVAASVALVEHIGAESLVALRLDQARTAHEEDQSEVMAVVQGYSELQPGQAVSLALSTEAAVLFDAASGQRLDAAAALAGAAT
jgi:multiple sugar transport system ATP-binding protein